MPGGLSAARAFLEVAAQTGRSALAVSGGADSLALLVLAHEAAVRYRAHDRFVVYSVDHGLRPEAADEVEQVLAIARGYGFVARGLRWEGKKPASGVQAAARTARYRLMAAAMRQDAATELFTAHHLRDQAETVLMRLAHGSGIDGLQGMRAQHVVEGCNVHRPLLQAHPDHLRQLVEAAGLRPIEDPSNADPSYERIRWRAILPQLEAMGLTLERLSTFSYRMGLAADLVLEAAQAATAALAMPLPGGGSSLPRDRFVALNPLVQVAVLEEMLRRIAEDDRPVPLAPLELLCRRIGTEGFESAATLHGCIVSARGKLLKIGREGPRRGTRRADLQIAGAQ